MTASDYVSESATTFEKPKSSLPQPYIQYFGRLEASQNNIAHLDIKNLVFIEDILVE